MKSKEEIEQLAANLANPNVCKTTNWIEGYTQCQEDMADRKYTEDDLHTILRLRKEWYSHTDKNVVRDFIKSQNKED